MFNFNIDFSIPLFLNSSIFGNALELHIFSILFLIHENKGLVSKQLYGAKYECSLDNCSRGNG